MTVNDRKKVLEYRAEILLDYLKENAPNKSSCITGKELLKVVSFSNGGHFRRAIHYLRMNGYPVMSCSKGYYYSDSKDDLTDMIDNLYTRMDGILDIINTLESLRDRLYGNDKVNG